MKITEIFTRRTPRTRRRPADTLAAISGWTSRDWADLPVHHPRQD